MNDSRSDGAVGLITELGRAAGIDVLQVGSLELVATKDVDAFLGVALRRRIRVLGIEGFRMDGESAIPEMDAIADFSNGFAEPDSAAASIRQSRRFIRAVASPEMLFDFVLAEPMRDS